MQAHDESALLFRFGVFELDLTTGILRKHGTRIKLQDQPVQILALLIQSAGRVVSREEIEKSLWPGGTFVDFDNAINGSVRKIREALGDDSENPRFIETLARRGYRFIAPVHEEPKAQSGTVREPITIPKEPVAQPQPQVRPRASSYWLRGVVCTGCLLLGAGLVFWLKPGYVEPPAFEALTYSGRDSSPVVSPDRKTVAFSSDRDGTPRVWLKQLNGGGEVPLTSGPDNWPRFSPDGSTILFSRSEGTHRSLYKIASVGGEPRRLIEDALDGDFSPDGRQIAFVRWKHDGQHQSSIIAVSTAKGTDVTQLAEVPDVRLDFPRWAPDGSKIATVGSGVTVSTEIYVEVWLVPLNRQQPYRLKGAGRERGVSSIVWTSNHTIVYALGDRTTPVKPEIVAHDTSTDMARRSPWVCCSLTLDIAGSEKLVFDQQAIRSSLLELSRENQIARWISHANSADRQPVFSPDGKRIAFSSNRDGHMNLWQISLVTGAINQLTEDNATDYDPAFSPDGRHLLFTSDRSGHFEVYMANADGSGGTQLTHDGVEAENATMTSDGQWIVYSSANPEKHGLWKIRPDGTDATQLLRGVGYNPEVSPDGSFALYITDIQPDLVEIHFVRISDGAEVPGRIQCWRRKQTNITLGRARWVSPASRGAAPAIAFIGQDETGATGVYLQDFVPGRDTLATRKPLRPFDAFAPIETLGVSPDGKTVMVSVADDTSSIMMASNVRELKLGMGN